MKNNFFIPIILLLSSLATLAQENIVKGKVSDLNGNPISGANVIVLNSSKGTLTSSDGAYILKGLSNSEYFIEVTFLGYQKITKQINVESGENTFDFQLPNERSALEEVVISANKRLQNIQTTAATVAAVTSEDIEKLQINELVELSSITPNFKSYDDGGGSFQTFASRGIYTIDVVPTIGLYVDNVPYFNISGFPSLLSDVERIEILKGPQGTLYGRNALAGVINVITKKPTNKIKGFASLGYGNLNQLRSSFGLGLPLVKDKLFLRVNSALLKRDGYIDNLATGSEDSLNARESILAGFKLSYYPNDKLSLNLTANFEKREANAYALIGGFGVTGEQINETFETDPYTVNFDREGVYETDISTAALTAKYDFNSMTLSSITSFQNFDLNRSNDDFDFTPFDVNYISEGERSQTTFSEELRLQSKNTSKLNWISGLYLYAVNQNEDIPIVNTPFTGNTAGEFTQVTESEIGQKGFALFGQLEYEFIDKLKAIAGLRYELETSEIDLKRFHTQNGQTFEGVGNEQVTPDGSFPNPLLTAVFDADANFDALSPKFGLSYEANDDIFIFGHITRGYRPGGLNQFVDSEEAVEYDPEFSWNYEVGVKTSWFNNKIIANLTAFYIRWEDQQLFTVVDNTSFTFGVLNLGESVSKGLELESKFLPAKGLSITANIGYLDTEITDFDIVSFGGPTNNKGNTQAYSPTWNGNLGINYEMPISKDVKIFMGADYAFQSDMFFDPENTVEQEAYGLLNGRVGAGFKNFELSFWGKNINDETYLSYGYGIGGAAAFANYGLPRTYGVTFTAKF